MVNKRKQKRRIKKAISIRKKERISRAWRNLFVQSGILK